jgi:hypoxanthine phosphoribosyltransferase
MQTNTFSIGFLMNNIQTINNVLKPTYNDIHKACEILAEHVIKMTVKIDRIVGVSRGGLIPAVIMSHIMDLPFTPISYSSTSGAGDNKNHHNVLPDVDGDVILIVDDICDTSLTLHEICEHYDTRGKIVYTAVLHFKERKDGKHVPDFYWVKVQENDGWIVYPFEVGGTL